jgi:hypothetical protein
MLAARRSLSAVVLAVAALASALLAPPAVAQSTLNGELFASQPGSSISCSPASRILSWNTHGIASGPVPGRFTESGQLGYDATGNVTTLAASFEIRDTPGGTVLATGVKRMPPDGDGGTVVDCNTGLFGGAPRAEYEATFPGSPGSEIGDSNIILNQGGTFFSETFATRSVPRVPQHFTAYETNSGSPSVPSETLTLTDAFGSESVRRGAPRLLLTPAGKRRPGRDPEPIERAEEHLKCYALSSTARQNRTVTVSNQFGTPSLLVKEANRLCAPAAKSLTGPPATDPEDTQHYKCYRVEETPRFSEAGVGLVDQFGTHTADVRSAELLCLAATKQRAGADPEPAPRPDEHLVCYDVTPRSPFSARDAFTRDQFASQTQRVLGLDHLCVPTTLGGGGGGGDT